MREFGAKKIHELVNSLFWAEVPDFMPEHPKLRLYRKVLDASRISIYEAFKTFVFKNNVLAVNGETVVADADNGMVDKFMFRRPSEMSREHFNQSVRYEVGAVMTCLGDIALDTTVTTKIADVFRLPGLRTETVVQTQPKIDLEVNRPMSEVIGESNEPKRVTEQTVRDLEELLLGTEQLEQEHGYYPDLALSSGNLRRNDVNGHLTLIDVMPIYSDGGRLINDGAQVLEPTLAAIISYEELVGQYGA